MAVEETKKAASALTDKFGSLAKWGGIVVLAAGMYVMGPAEALRQGAIVVGKAAGVIGGGLEKGGAQIISSVGSGPA